VGKHQRTGRPLACLHVREVFFANEPRQRFSDRQQQRLGRPPPAHRPKLQTMDVLAGHYSPEPFVAVEQPVERLQLVQIFWPEWPPFVLPNEPSEPFAQASRLSRDIVELS